MARPTKSAKLLHERSQTKAEIDDRIKKEEQLKGQSDKIEPPEYLNRHQRKLFRYIVEQLGSSGILGNLDVYVLSTCVIAIDRLQEIERMINEDTSKIGDKGLMAAKDKYTRDLFRCTNELSLSPASRAKIGNINLQNKTNKSDPLLQALEGVDNN